MEKQLIMDHTIPIYDYDTIVYKCEKKIIFMIITMQLDGLIYPSIALDTISNCGVINNRDRPMGRCAGVRIKYLDDTSICTNIGGITDTNKDCIFDDGYKLPCIFNSRVDDYDDIFI